MVYNYFLFFLGIYSWNYKSTNLIEYLFQKKQLNLTLLKQNKNNKKLIKFDETDSNSPNLNLYLQSINLKELDINLKYKILFYNLYSITIFLFLSIQPSYLLYNTFNNTNNNFLEYLVSFLINIYTPINYIWAKYYFTTNHFDIYINDCDNNCSYFIFFIVLITIISILISFINIESFYNEFYFIYKMDTLDKKL